MKGQSWVSAFAVGLLVGCGASVRSGEAGGTPSDRAFSDYRTERPGQRHHIRPEDLPPPFATRSAGNPPRIVPRPAQAWPQVPRGFEVQVYADGFNNVRLLRTAPNGDIFAAETATGTVYALRGTTANGRCKVRSLFGHAGDGPYGIAFYPPGPQPRWVYVANHDKIVRFPYRVGDLKARGLPEVVVAHLPTGGHATRDVTFSSDGQAMYVAIGSLSNVEDPDEVPAEQARARVLVGRPDGTDLRTFAWGTRNPSSLAVSPRTQQLWASVIERDGLGDNLVPDFVTHLEPRGFYGWPYYYTGGFADPRLQGRHPELKSQVQRPDVLLQAHASPLQITFYPEGLASPPALGKAFAGHLFATLHGSWNRSLRTGYAVVHIPVDARGRASGGYEELVTGFVTASGEVWGRPVGITTAPDGALLFSDDASNTIWRVSRKP